MCVLSHSVVSDSATPWTVAYQAPLSMGFPGQEHWSGLPFPTPGGLSDPGIEPMSPALASRVFTTDPLRRPPAILLKNIFLNYFIPTSLLSSVQYYIVHELRQGLCGDQEIRFWGDIKRIEEC